MDTLLAIDGLSKHFGPIVAVDGISFRVGRGEMLGFLGPNGAGKSTTMRMITGYLPPSDGRITVCGIDLDKDPIEVRRRIGYLPEGAPAYGDMTPRSLLEFVASIRGIGGDERRRRIDAVVERLQLEDVLLQPIETLSKGFKRRVGLAVALLHDPEVLILDEPTDGLDPNQKHQVRRLLSELAADKAIIISTHILEEVEAICTRAIIIAKGRLVADARPTELLARSIYHNAIGLRLPAAEAERAAELLSSIDRVDHVEEAWRSGDTAQLIVFPRQGTNVLDAVRQKVDEHQVPVTQVYVDQGRLDEVFRELTRAA